MKDVLIYGEIGWDVTAEGVREQLAGAAGEDIRLRIHSPGGSVLEGVAIMTALQEHDGTVSALVDGFAGSMAAVIALAAGHLTMPENAWIMFHEVSGGGYGGADDLERQVDVMRQMNEWMVRALSVRMGLDEDEVVPRLKSEIWLTGAAALEAGIAHEVTRVLPMAARAWVGRFAHAPAEVRVMEQDRGQHTEVDEIDKGWRAQTGGSRNDKEMSEKKYSFWDSFRGKPAAEKAAELAAENASLENQVAAMHGVLAEDGPIFGAVSALAEAQNRTNLRLDGMEEALLERLQKRVDAEALRDLAASQGVPAAEAPEGRAAAEPEEEKKPLTAYEQWDALEGAEKSEYYRAHQSAILRSMPPMV